MNKRILLDTHVWIWYLNGDPTLANKIKKIIDSSAIDDALHISAISVWEVAMLVFKKRISINTSTQAWVNKALSLPGISLVPLSPEIAIESCELAENFHGDPADRILVATSKIENLCLISRDNALNTYCNKHDINIIKA